MEQTIVALPRGIPIAAEGRWIRHVHLRQITGNDERLIADLPSLLPHRRILALLELMARFEEGDTSDLLRQLSIGDRAALILHARRLELGDSLDCIVVCTKCRQNMSVALSIAELLDAKHPEPSISYEIDLGGLRFEVRPLTALDQDKIVGMSEKGGIEEALARSCVVNSDRPHGEELPIQLIDAIGSKLEEVDPLSAITLHLSCAECNHKFASFLDIEDFVYRELGSRSSPGNLESEVHWLAFYYHWSEAEILSLPVRRRKRYMSLIKSTIAGEKT
jgi:hypothetical protein